MILCVWVLWVFATWGPEAHSEHPTLAECNRVRLEMKDKRFTGCYPFGVKP